MGNIIVMACR